MGEAPVAKAAKKSVSIQDMLDDVMSPDDPNPKRNRDDEHGDDAADESKKRPRREETAVKEVYNPNFGDLAEFLQDTSVLGGHRVYGIMAEYYGQPSRIRIQEKLARFLHATPGILRREFRDALEETWFKIPKGIRNSLEEAVMEASRQPQPAGVEVGVLLLEDFDYLYEAVESLSQVILRTEVELWRDPLQRSYRDPNHARRMEILNKFWAPQAVEAVQTKTIPSGNNFTRNNFSANNSGRNNNRKKNFGGRGSFADRMRNRCLRCGDTKHRRWECKVPEDVVCEKCKSKGHTKTACLR